MNETSEQKQYETYDFISQCKIKNLILYLQINKRY